MEVDSQTRSQTKSVSQAREQMGAMREAFRQRMEAKKKKTQRPVKLSVKQKVISKGTSYSDKFEMRRKNRLSLKSTKRGNTNAAINKLGQKHASINLSKVTGMAMTKAEKKRLLKKKAREAQRMKQNNTEMDGDWVSASSDEEDDQVVES